MKTRAARTKVYLLQASTDTVGLVAGLGTSTFTSAPGLSDFSNAPLASMNCRIMREQFDGGQKSPRHAVASCNDGPTPKGFPAISQQGGALR